MLLLLRLMLRHAAMRYHCRALITLMPIFALRCCLPPPELIADEDRRRLTTMAEQIGLTSVRVSARARGLRVIEDTRHATACESLTARRDEFYAMITLSILFTRDAYVRYSVATRDMRESVDICLNARSVTPDAFDATARCLSGRFIVDAATFDFSPRHAMIPPCCYRRRRTRNSCTRPHAAMMPPPHWSAIRVDMMRSPADAVAAAADAAAIDDAVLLLVMLLRFITLRLMLPATLITITFRRCRCFQIFRL